MATFAHMAGNTVHNIIVAESFADAEAILGVGSVVEYDESNPAQIGWIYDGKTFFAPKNELIAEVTTDPVK